jgi:hypothetical protein
VHDSRVSPRAPLKILCQHDRGSCAACCGVDNFIDRSDDARRDRLRRRTRLVHEAGFDVERLVQAKETLLALERPGVLFGNVKVCPFAGYVDGDDDPHERIGCLLHPLRHPTGEDLRDLSVYPQAVCAGHFCASHDWLRPVEVALAQAARGPTYGRVVTSAGLVKGVARLIVDARQRPVTPSELERADDALSELWRQLLERWPFVDPDPRRFGAFVYDGDEATERSAPSCCGASTQTASAQRPTPTERSVLDALGTRPLLDDDEAAQALMLLRQSVTAVVRALDG